MSEENTLSATTETPAPASSSAAASSTTRKKAPAKAASAARKSRQQRALRSTPEAFGVAALASESRARNPSVDDPFQGGHRIWPD